MIFCSFSINKTYSSELIYISLNPFSEGIIPENNGFYSYKLMIPCELSKYSAYLFYNLK